MRYGTLRPMGPDADGEMMVSTLFTANIYQLVQKQLGDLLNGQVTWHMIGSGQDQFKGMGDELKTAIIPFRKSTYQAEEWFALRAPLKDELVKYIDFTCPLVNVKGTTVPGVGTFVTHVPIPCKETYVERMVGLKYQLLPHALVNLQKRKPKEVIKGGFITSRAINAVNNDKETIRSLEGRRDCKVMTGFGSNHYKVEFDAFNHPYGMFSVMPYHGSAVMVARDAGGSSAKVDRPDYDFRRRFEAFQGVAKALRAYPEIELSEGVFYIDEALEILALPLMSYLKGGSAPPQT